MPELLIEDPGERVHRRRIQELLDRTSGPIRIASPYITETALLPRLAQRDARILTSTTPDDVATGSSSLSALEELLRLKIPCCYHEASYLHAKIYIFGDEFAIVSSANFTKKALYHNLEIGVQVDGPAVSELCRWFDSLWLPDKVLTLEELERIRPEVESKEFVEAKKAKPQIGGWRFAGIPNGEPDLSQDTSASEYPHSPELVIQPTSRIISLLRIGRPGWVCNTKREPSNYPLPIKLEELMRRRFLAATWQDGKIYDQMREVDGGDLILMHGNKGGPALPGLQNGIVGIGIAKEGSFKPLAGHDPQRLSLAELGDQGPSELENLPEWRISIEKWLFWDPENPIEVDGTPASFYSLTEDRRNRIMRRLQARLADAK